MILYIHGGGFTIGKSTETAADLRWFADRGWLVVSVEYRLFGPGNPTWDKAPDDVACALATYENAARFGGVGKPGWKDGSRSVPRAACPLNACGC